MPPVRYIADLTGVRELALHGAADRGWWREHLAGEGLEPIEADGAAQVLVTGLDARWLLWPFRDLSVSVMARRSGSGETGLYFARAFNASRFMVFGSRWRPGAATRFSRACGPRGFAGSVGACGSTPPTRGRRPFACAADHPGDRGRIPIESGATVDGC